MRIYRTGRPLGDETIVLSYQYKRKGVSRFIPLNYRPPDKFGPVSKESTGPTYEAEASALFLRFTTPATVERKAIINTLIKTLKDGGIWAVTDVLYVFAAADSQVAKLNWVEDAHNCDEVGAVTFVANQGYSQTGGSKYLQTNYNPSTQGVYVSRNSISTYYYVRTSSAGYIIGNTSTTRLNPHGNSTTAIFFANSSTNSNITVPVNAVGFFGYSRSAASAANVYYNKTETAVTTASAALVSANFRILSDGLTSYALAQISFAIICGNLTTAQETILADAVEVYMDALGYGVM